MNLIDFIFPKKCVGCGFFGSYICRKCFSEIEFIEKPICAVCARQAVGGRTHLGCATKYTLDGLIVASRYRGVVRKAIVKLKYRWISTICMELVDLLVGVMWKYDLSDEVILIPVPLHLSRRKWRGFNQAELLATALAKRFKVRINVSLLYRVINTKTQVGLTRDERRKNIKGAFRVIQNEKCKGKSFILVDDVFTTGATISEACRVLKQNGAKNVWGMAVALD